MVKCKFGGVQRFVERVGLSSLSALIVLASHTSYSPCSHPGCECPPLYYGDHCEFIKNGIDLEGEGLMSDARISIKRREDLRRYGMMSLYIFITAIVLTGLVLYTRRRLLQRRRRRRRGRRKKHDGNIQMNLHSFRDENFGASSPNGAMLFPSFRRPDREITITDRLHNVQIS